VERREKDLTDRETSLAGRERNREKLESEAVDLAKVIAELCHTVERLERRKTDAEAVLVEAAECRATLDRRQLETERNQQALDKRIAELDLTEKEIRIELEAREAEITRQRAELAEELRAARLRLPVEPATRMPTSITSPTPPGGKVPSLAPTPGPLKPGSLTPASVIG
jgi:hypothetical protein